MLSEIEKEQFLDKSIDYLTNHIIGDGYDGVLLFKVLVNFLDKTKGNELQYSQLNERVLTNQDLLRRYCRDVLVFMAEVATEEREEVVEYTTGDLAKYFGVSITTINNWIKEKRFVGFNRSESHKQARIKGDTLWIARTGKVYPVQEIVDDWIKENQEIVDTHVDERDFLIRQLAAFESRYGGPYQNTLGKKTLSEMTAQEETDASAWRYFSERLNNEYGM